MFDLRLGDCLDVMNTLEDKSINLILTDLPYGTTSAEWDSVIPFDKLWGGYNRIIKDNGVICLFATEPFATELRHTNIRNYKYDWIWKKNTSTGFTHAKNMPLRDYENILVFSKAPVGHKNLLGDRRMPYNPQGLQECNKLCNNKLAGRLFSIRGYHTESKYGTYTQYNTNYPKMVIEYDNNDKQYHPTQKPVDLLEYLIRTYTDEGNIVLDSCMGSGSTGVACLKSGRDFIGIEKEQKFYDIANERMNTFQSGLF